MTKHRHGVCATCSTFSEELAEHKHQFNAGTHILWLCLECKSRLQDLCRQNIFGVHGEIVDATEDPTYIYPLTDGLLDSQLGYCVKCREPMFWDVDKQRWESMEVKVP